jgi:hypothetical protein
MNNYDPNNVNWKKVKEGMDKYVVIMDLFHRIDVSKDTNFQKKFNGFYKIRQRSQEFYFSLYNFLEDNKKSNDLGYETVLRHFKNKFNKLEVSFSSKLLATINPELPIWDSVVMDNLKLKKPGYNKTIDERLVASIEIYNKMILWYDEQLKSKVGKQMLKDFNDRIPEANITDLKKIDLILWQTRKGGNGSEVLNKQ